MRYFFPSWIFQIKEGNHVIDSIEYIYTKVFATKEKLGFFIKKKKGRVSFNMSKNIQVNLAKKKKIYIYIYIWYTLSTL